MEKKKEQLNIKISKTDLKTIKQNAEIDKKSVSEFIRTVCTKPCRCGEPGYEGVGMVQVDWTCGKCGTKNTWRATK